MTIFGPWKQERREVWRSLVVYSDVSYQRATRTIIMKMSSPKEVWDRGDLSSTGEDNKYATAQEAMKAYDAATIGRGDTICTSDEEVEKVKLLI